MMYCPDCDASLDEVPVGEACPNCGGRRRAAIASPPPVAVVAVVEEVSYKITRSDHRPWEEKWRLVLHLRQQLAEAYAGNVPKGGNVEIDTHVTSFCVECYHFPEWLIGDLASIPGVSDTAIRHHKKATPLVIAEAVANSHKHHTRIQGKTTARIRDTSVGSTGATVTIEVDWATPQATTIDALDLADQCVDSWRSFFKQYGIVEP